MPFSFTSVKSALGHVFHMEEDKAHHLLAAVEADITPVVTQAQQQLHDLIGEGQADIAALITKGLADIRADIAELKGGSTPVKGGTANNGA